jgi:hypothetical protein
VQGPVFKPQYHRNDFFAYLFMLLGKKVIRLQKKTLYDKEYIIFHELLWKSVNTEIIMLGQLTIYSWLHS